MLPLKTYSTIASIVRLKPKSIVLCRATTASSTRWMRFSSSWLFSGFVEAAAKLDLVILAVGWLLLWQVVLLLSEHASLVPSC
jgi:hypothetical protein